MTTRKPTGKLPNAALASLTDEELAAELEARKQRQQQAPTPLTNPNWAKFQKFITDSITDIANGGRVKDFDHYVYEEALSTVYGKDFWKWWNAGPGNRE